MSRRGVTIALSLSALVILLFVGRWGAGLLTDRWWAELVSPEASRFVMDWNLLRFTLEAGGVLIACAWFIGHLLVVFRAIGSVQVPRQLANLEIREALNTRVLIFGGVASGALLGFIVGRGLGDWTPTLALAWTGVRYGETEPMLGHDLGLYLAQLPLWRSLHGHALLLVLLGLGGVLTLYVVIGAVRWTDSHLALNSHARVHLGMLLAALALCLVWGYLLEPYELVSGIGGGTQLGLFNYQRITTQILAGVALMTAALSLLWAWRANHVLMAAGWGVLITVSLVGHHVFPALLAGARPSPVDQMDRRRLEALAYGLTGLRDSTSSRPDAAPRMPNPPTLWSASIVTRLPASDSGEVLGADRAVLPVLRRPRPVWLIVRGDGEQGSSVTAIADDQTSDDGKPLYYPGGDSVPSTQPATRLRLSRSAVWPGAPNVVLDTAPGGVRVGGALRRVVLAWALQSSSLLGKVESDARARWYLTPAARLDRLAPFASWSVAVPRIVNGNLVWISDGYIASQTFPIASRVRWRGQRIGTLRADFVGVIEAESGETRIYLRHTADKVAEAWLDIAGGVVLPANSIPPEIGRVVPYPAELLQVQGRVMEGQDWGIGRMVTHPDSLGGGNPVPESVWEPDTSGLQSLVVFENGGERAVASLLQARMVDGWESLKLVRFDSSSTLPSPQMLESRWGRFPTYEQIRDSVLGAGGQLQAAPVRYWLGPAGLGAYQPHVAWNSGETPALVWVSIASQGRGGAGHDLFEAWQNMFGITAPLVAAAGHANRLEEARRLMAAADSALKRGDMAAFGRAFDALRRVLNAKDDRQQF
jgi:hypothetical protein